jgi:hypothetical protein
MTKICIFLVGILALVALALAEPEPQFNSIQFENLPISGMYFSIFN